MEKASHVREPRLDASGFALERMAMTEGNLGTEARIRHGSGVVGVEGVKLCMEHRVDLFAVAHVKCQNLQPAVLRTRNPMRPTPTSDVSRMLGSINYL